MEPRIDKTQFGSVTIDGAVFTHDGARRPFGQPLTEPGRLTVRRLPRG